MQIELSENLVLIEISKDNFVKKDGVVLMNDLPLYALGTIILAAPNLTSKTEGTQVLLAEKFKDLGGEKIILPFKEILGFILK